LSEATTARTPQGSGTERSEPLRRSTVASGQRRRAAPAGEPILLVSSELFASVAGYEEFLRKLFVRLNAAPFESNGVFHFIAKWIGFY
jgi:hypothetical protein